MVIMQSIVLPKGYMSFATSYKHNNMQHKLIVKVIGIFGFLIAFCVSVLLLFGIKVLTFTEPVFP
jgi:hypothetical protein